MAPAGFPPSPDLLSSTRLFSLCAVSPPRTSPGPCIQDLTPENLAFRMLGLCCGLFELPVVVAVAHLSQWIASDPCIQDPPFLSPLVPRFSLLPRLLSSVPLLVESRCARFDQEAPPFWRAKRFVRGSKLGRKDGREIWKNARGNAFRRSHHRLVINKVVDASLSLVFLALRHMRWLCSLKLRDDCGMIEDSKAGSIMKSEGTALTTRLRFAKRSATKKGASSEAAASDATMVMLGFFFSASHNTEHTRERPLVLKPTCVLSEGPSRRETEILFSRYFL